MPFLFVYRELQTQVGAIRTKSQGGAMTGLMVQKRMREDLATSHQFVLRSLQFKKVIKVHTLEKRLMKP